MTVWNKTPVTGILHILVKYGDVLYVCPFSLFCYVCMVRTCCDCHTSKYCYGPVGHIVTGDLKHKASSLIRERTKNKIMLIEGIVQRGSS